jgi:dipeptidyl-peptidase-3
VGSKLYNLKIKALEHIYQNYKGDKSTEDSRILLKKECGFQTESTIIILMKKSSLISESYFSFLMKETETELAPSITAILFNEIDSKKVNLMCLKDCWLVLQSIFYDKDYFENRRILR